jgi:hypothetical protein
MIDSVTAPQTQINDDLWLRNDVDSPNASSKNPLRRVPTAVRRRMRAGRHSVAIGDPHVNTEGANWASSSDHPASSREH